MEVIVRGEMWMEPKQRAWEAIQWGHAKPSPKGRSERILKKREGKKSQQTS